MFFGFAGGLRDIDTELVHFGARDYDPSIARWLAKDAIGFAGGDSNLYAYVDNDPVNLIDTDGMSAEQVIMDSARYGVLTLISVILTLLLQSL
jgi:RHS repeat-associated protein